MKVKLDFVSNSSSTSFVYISDSELSEESFLEAAGVDTDSPISNLFRQMHAELNHSIHSYGKKIKTKIAADELNDGHKFTPEVIEKMKEAIDKEKNVIISQLSSDESLAEITLCVAIFEIESDDFYINAYNNTW